MAVSVSKLECVTMNQAATSLPRASSRESLEPGVLRHASWAASALGASRLNRIRTPRRRFGVGKLIARPSRSRPRLLRGPPMASLFSSRVNRVHDRYRSRPPSRKATISDPYEEIEWSSRSRARASEAMTRRTISPTSIRLSLALILRGVAVRATIHRIAEQPTECASAFPRPLRQSAPSMP